jgi:hypothetical protein
MQKLEDTGSENAAVNREFLTALGSGQPRDVSPGFAVLEQIVDFQRNPGLTSAAGPSVRCSRFFTASYTHAHSFFDASAAPSDSDFNFSQQMVG